TERQTCFGQHTRKGCYDECFITASDMELEKGAAGISATTSCKPAFFFGKLFNSLRPPPYSIIVTF
ncbi:hypothetical protein STEG23_028898, partial [Scotinomys teguina]